MAYGDEEFIAWMADLIERKDNEGKEENGVKEEEDDN